MDSSAGTAGPPTRRLLAQPSREMVRAWAAERWSASASSSSVVGRSTLEDHPAEDPGEDGEHHRADYRGEKTADPEAWSEEGRQLQQQGVDDQQEESQGEDDERKGNEA